MWSEAHGFDVMLKYLKILGEYLCFIHLSSLSIKRSSDLTVGSHTSPRALF